jgi:ABC-type glycerol-3-phosphate transport system substrate-binding protein
VRSAALALLLAALAVAGCGGGEKEPTSASGVRQLDNVLTLRSDFEADHGKTRLLVLLSPT